MFKRQTLAFHFSSYPPNSFIDLSHHTPVRPYERIDCCDCSIGRQNNMATRSFLVNNAFSTMSKLFTPNIYYWSRKYLSPLYWMHLRLNGVCSTSFCPPKTSNRTLFLARRDAFSGNAAMSNVNK